MSIRISTDIRRAVEDQAVAGYPREICGLVLGHWRGEQAVGRSYHPCSNDSSGARERRFLIDPQQYQALEDQADEQGLSIVSIVHTHPDHPDLPSEFDRLHAWPGLSYIILSVVSGRVASMSAWRLREDRSAFDPDPIRIATDDVGG